jgi:hypothetical protein
MLLRSLMLMYQFKFSESRGELGHSAKMSFYSGILYAKLNESIAGCPEQISNQSDKQISISKSGHQRPTTHNATSQVQGVKNDVVLPFGWYSASATSSY